MVGGHDGGRRGRKEVVEIDKEKERWRTSRWWGEEEDAGRADEGSVLRVRRRPRVEVDFA